MENTEKETPILEGYYKLAYAGFNWTSFDPERRARQTIDSYSQQLEEDLETVKKYNASSERYKQGYIKKFAAWLGARSRCISSAITGPSNFPTRRAEKANRSEHNRYEEFDSWRTKVLNKIKKPESTVIVKGTEGAIEKMEVKLAKLEADQALMKTVNKICRAKYKDEDRRVLDLMEEGITYNTALSLTAPKETGFDGFYLTNNGANIRNLKKSIEAEKDRLAKYSNGNKEYTKGGVKIVENVEDNRLQLFYDGKPEDKERMTLKRHAFKWSPRNGCWQRQLTNNAIYSLKFVFPKPDIV
jgi:hypothetical protein